MIFLFQDFREFEVRNRLAGAEIIGQAVVKKHEPAFSNRRAGLAV
jgi:hypothetical protein